MNISYKGVVISGVIAGILVGGLQIFGICCFPVDLIVLFAAGALAAHLSAETVREQNDILVNGALAGLVGGIIGGIIGVIVSMLISTLSALLGSSYDSQYGAGILAMPLLTGMMKFVCCLPVMILSGIAMGALGALAYHALKK